MNAPSTGLVAAATCRRATDDTAYGRAGLSSLGWSCRQTAALWSVHGGVFTGMDSQGMDYKDGVRVAA